MNSLPGGVGVGAGDGIGNTDATGDTDGVGDGVADMTATFGVEDDLEGGRPSSTWWG